MPITVDDMRRIALDRDGKARERDERVVKSFQEQIDTLLRQRFIPGPGRRLTICPTVPRCPFDEMYVRQRVTEEYVKGGWRVEWGVRMEVSLEEPAPAEDPRDECRACHGRSGDERMGPCRACGKGGRL